MSSPKEFREFAVECMRQAEESRDERQRQMLLDLAARWMRAAVQVERSIDDDVSLIPKDKT
jgi:hypothetical protein